MAGSQPAYSYALNFASDGDVSFAKGAITGEWNFKYDEMNRLTSINDPAITWNYDRLGNVINDGLDHAYTYDAENRLLKLEGSILHDR